MIRAFSRQHHARRGRGAVISVTLLFLVSLLLQYASLVGAPSALAVDPVLVVTSLEDPALDGNPTCIEFKNTYGGGQPWQEIKSDPAKNEVIAVAGFGTITVSDFDNDGTKGFTWTSTFGIDAVFLKNGGGGGGYNTLYVYAPTAASPEAMSGSTTTESPTGISHISFCFDADPKLEIEKTAGAANVDAGQAISFTIIVKSTGGLAATGVTLNDPLPGGDGIDWSENSDSCSITGTPPAETLTCSFGDMAKDTQKSVTVTSQTTADSCGEYQNKASAQATNHAKVEATAKTNVRCADIDVQKDADAASVNAGDQIGFTVTLSNDGDAAATGILFTDNLPGGSGVSWSINPASAGWSITGSAPNQVLAYAPTTLAANSSTSVHVVSSTTAASCKLYDNTASVTTGNDGSDSDSASTTVKCADIDVEKDADAASVSAGEQIGFTVTISNHGDGAASGLSFTDNLPGGTGISWSISPASPGWSITGSAPNQQLVYSPTTLAGNTSTSVHVVSNTTGASCATYNNTASVATTNDGQDSDSASTDVLCADIDVEKTADAPSVNAGEQIGFTVTLSNDGDGEAKGIAFTDNLPGGSGVSWSINPASAGWSITGSAPNQVLAYAPTTLAANSSTSVHVVSSTSAASCATYNNTASVSTTNDGSDSDSDSTQVLCADIDVEKEADADEVSAGEQIGFTVTISNDGAGTAMGLSFTDNLPGGTGIDWSISPASPGWSITGTAPNQVLVYSPTTLAGNTSTSVHIVSNTTGASCATYNNTASVSTTNDGSDSDSDSTTVLCADIDVEKTADAGSVSAGSQIGFVVTISNDGDGEAKGLAFSDTLPGGPGISWSIESQSGTGFSITGIAPNQVLVFTPTTMAANSSASVHIVSATSAASCATYNNTASVTTTNDGQDSSSAETQVLCADIDVEKEADAVSANAGEQIGFTVTISNDGDGLATGLTFTDNLPGGTGIDWSISPASAGWSITGTAPNQVLVYTPTTLAGNSSTSVHVVSSTTAASCAKYDNTASVSTGNDGSDSDSASTTVLCADIDVEKAADAASVNAGEQIGFTVTISNDGEGTATGLAFTDNLPGGPGITWSIESQSGGFSITGTAPNQVLAYAPTTLAGMTSVWVHVVSATTGASCGTFNNTASVMTGNDGSDSDSASTEVKCADIDVEKTADAPSVNAGEQIGFTVTLSNDGDGDATGITFTDNLPGGAGIDWSISPASTGWSITGSAPNQVLVYSPTTLAANSSTSVHVVSSTTAASCATYNNTASVSAGNDGQDSSSAETQVRCADIDVEKEADAASVNAGEQIGFTVTLSNDGEGAATGLAFTDNLPGGTGIDWSISPASTGWSITGTAPNQVLVYSPTTLAANSSTSVHVVSATTADSCATYNNTASVSTGNDGQDSDSASTTVLCAEIDVEKTADDPVVFAGEQIGFTVTLSNTGDGAATGLAFTDNLPGGPGISWSIGSQSGGFSITGTAPNQQLVFAPTTLAGNSSAWVHVVSETTEASCATYDNTASVTTGNDGQDSDSASIQVGCADLQIDKTAAEPGYDEVGDVINYLITVTNAGDITLFDVIVTDLQVDDLECTPDTPVPTLAPGASFTCTASHTITQDDLDVGAYFNEACTDDGNGDGNVGALPVCDDVTVFGQQTGGETDIPSQPPTDGLGRGGSGPQGGAWLLVIVLGAILAAAVVITPERVRRRT
jgi:uncharacterized repeat protein (TIGR01451 family)